MRFPALPSGEYALDIEVEGFPCATRVELLVDVLNVLNDTAEEGLATDNLLSPTFGQPIVFIDPRRTMLGVTLTLGR